MKYMNKTLMLMAAALMAFSACDKWTETEPVNVIYETLESKNPDLYAKYLQSLRDYHVSAHQVLIAKFDNKAEAPSGRADHISCLPDSVDFVVLNNPSLLNDQIRKEMTEIREQKGVKTLMNVSWDAMLAEYNAILADETEAKNAEWDALSDEEKEAQAEKYASDPEGLENASLDDLSGLLVTAGVPDPDLIIRTSGEQRISNYLLWQAAYSELLFVDTLWPDFRKEEFRSALEEYSKRNRRYGKVK